MVSIAFDKFTLSNGLDVILSEDHSLPVTAVNVWYHVGSKDEEPGRTGFAHLFEHVMFEGSEHHNHSYFDPLQKVGANLNGSTTPDRTNYWENLPSNYLELALWLESDRMGFLLDALDQKRFEVQRDIVKNERRQNYENRPYGMAPMLIQPNLFPPPHPYNWTTIGSPEDLDSASLDDIKDFFRKFYSPSNASLAIVGDFDPSEVRSQVEQYFGEIPAAPAVDRVGRMDSKLSGQVSLTTHDRVQLPRLYLVWPTGPMFDSDHAPLDLMASILGDGKSSRLYRTMVHDRQIAREVRVEHYAQEIAGEFSIQVTANPGHSLDELETVIAEELELMKSEPPAAEELARAKTRIETSHVMQLERFGGFGGRADQLNYYNTLCGDPGAINTDVQRYLDVTAEDIHQVSATIGGNQVKLVVNPEEAREVAATTIDRTSAPDAAPEPRFSPPVPQRVVLDNGLKVVHLERSGVPTVAFGLVLSGGALADPASKSGLANLTAAMLAEGTHLRTSNEISDQLEALGTHLRHHASREFAMVSCDSLTSNWRAALEIVSDVVRTSIFPDHELDRIRKDLMTDFSRIEDNPLAIASRAARSLFYGPGTPYGHPLTGNEQSVTAIDRADIEAYHRSHFGPSSATFIVVGSVSLDEAVDAAQAAFGDWSNNETASSNGAVQDANGATPTRIYIADKPGAAQSIIRAGHLTVPRAHEHYLRLTMLNYIFGGQFASRLNNNLRQDKGYSYGYSSMIDWSHGPSMLMAGGGVQTDVTKEALFETIKEFNEIASSRPVTQEEFVDARNGILRSIPGQFETQHQILQHLTRMVVFGLPDDYFTTFADSVSAITLDDIHRAAEDMLDTEHLRILVVGDGDVIRSGVAELGIPVSDVDYEGRLLE
ncbi:MAG: pitrilysin family protein [SAR202 cluster bacterium]|nr:pitrilysin family protein [SAR202 cluster bacterium]MDP7413955.1 pitrilysin family protein [SAR202 cluster bacterium]